MPYSTPIKSMHIACIISCRFCRYCKATNSVQPQRFWVSYKHNGAYFTHSVTFCIFLWFLCLHALHTLNLVWPWYIYVHCAHWLFAQRCTKTLLHHAHSHCSTMRFSAKMLFTTLTALQDDNRVAPLDTTTSTNHRASWWECRKPRL